MNLEQRMKEIQEELKESVSKSVQYALHDCHAELLPHLDNDTFMNVSYRCQGVIENLIAGNFHAVDDNKIQVSDSNGITVDIRVTDFNYDRIRDSLIKAMPACPKDKLIESLKKTIYHLESI